MPKEYLIAHQVSLKPYNTMRIEAKAETVYMPYSVKGAADLMEDVRDESAPVIGNGSNIIFAEEDYQSPMILTSLMKQITMEGERIVAQCGVSLSELAWFALEHSIPGFEFLEDIPGSVGGALYMNAGTYDNCIGDLVSSVTVYDLTEKRVTELAKNQLAKEWKKRDSYFQHHKTMILQCTFEAAGKDDYLSIFDRMFEIKKKRFVKQPRNYPSAGSVFKRPYINGEPRYIWQLMDESGLRGYRIGDAQVSEKHPGFIVNTGDASGKDIVCLMNHCKAVIRDKFGICIEEEWKIL